MAQNSKIIRELESKRTGLLKELADNQIRLGYDLMAKESLFVEFENQKQRKEDVKQHISELEGRTVSIATSITDKKSETAMLEKEFTAACHSLGEFLFACADPSLGEETYELQNKIRTLESNLTGLESEIAAAGFFKKVPLQVKKGGLQNSISSEKKKLAVLLDAKARTAVTEKLISAENGGNDYAECCRIRDEIFAVQTTDAELTAEKAAAEIEIKESRTKLTEIERYCDSLETQCNDQALTEAEKYTADYIDDKGVVLSSFPKKNEDKLEAIRVIVQGIAAVNRTIEIKKTEDAIADCRAQIEKMQTDYNDTCRAIEKLQEHNKSVLANIEGTKNLLENYEEQKKALETAADSETTE